MEYFNSGDDLDRFINGQICFDDIQGYILGNIHIESAIIFALKHKPSSFYTKEEHDIYEKLCYATLLYSMQFYSPSSLYAEYLVAKDVSTPHKLDWDCLLYKIKREFNMSESEMSYGHSLYENYKSGYSSS